MLKQNPQDATAGVLLAAGRGQRMGRLKQLLPWVHATVVESAFDGMSPHCPAGMIVVVGAGADEILKTLGDARRFTAVTSNPDAEQLASIEIGVREALRLTDAQSILVHPADHPIVPAEVVEGILAESARTKKVVIPTINGRGGHPIVMPRAVAASILEWIAKRGRHDAAGSGGLRQYWAMHPRHIVRLPFDPAQYHGLCIDLDTPDDYERAKRELEVMNQGNRMNV